MSSRMHRPNQYRLRTQSDTGAYSYMYDSSENTSSVNSSRESSFLAKKLAVRTSFGWNPFQKRNKNTGSNEPDSFLMQQHKPLLDTNAEEAN